MGLFGLNVSKRQTWSTGLVFVLASLLAGTPVSAAPKSKGKVLEVSDIAFDPSAVRGELPNGMKYVFLPNAKPEKALVVRLYIASGSYDETNAERGAAQALAQMALQETKHFAGTDLKNAFATKSIEFGSPRNAYADLSGSIFSVEIENDDPAKLELGLTWLRDVADGMAIQPANLEKARSSLNDQYKISLGGPKEVTDALNGFLTPNLRTAKRDPIATPAEIDAINLTAIQQYYSKWYRPQNAYLIIVGSAKSADVIAAIQARFGSWSALSPPKREKVANPADNRGLMAMTKTVSGIRPLLSVCRTLPAKAIKADSLNNRIEMANQFGWITVLNNRLSQIAVGANSPFSSVGAQLSKGREVNTICLQAIPVGDQWQLAQDALAAELARLEQHRISSDELRNIYDAEVTEHNKAIDKQSDRLTSDLVENLTRAVIEQKIPTSPMESKRIALAVSSSVTPDSVFRGFKSSWIGAGPFISLISPDAVNPSALKVRWEEAISKPQLARQVGKIVWPYGEFGPKGEIVSRDLVNPPGFTRVRFKNGVILNVKQFAPDKDYIWIRVRFGTGHQQIDPAYRPTANIAASMLVLGGLGQLSLDQIRQANAGKQWGMQLFINRDAFVILGDTKISDIEREIETITAFLADPGFRSEADVKIPGLVDSFYKSAESPTGKALLEISDTYGGDTLLGVPSREELSAVKMRDISALLKLPMQSEVLEVTLVGDIGEDKAIDLIARTFGALPTRNAELKIRSDFKPLTYGPGKSFQIDIEDHSEKSAIAIIWPTFVADNARRMETRSVVVLTEIIRARLKANLSKAKLTDYDLVLTPQFPNRLDQGSINLTLQVPTSKIADFRTIINDTILNLRNPKISAAELKAVLKPILDNVRASQNTSGWWTNIMDGSARDPSIIDIGQSTESDLLRLKPKNVSDAAAQWLKPENMIEVIAAPKPPIKSAESSAPPPTRPQP